MTRIVSFSFGLLIASGMALVLFMSVKANFENTFSLLNDKAILTIQSMERQVRGHLDQVEDAAVALKRLFDEGMMKPEASEQTLADLSAAAAANGRLSVILIRDLRGNSFGIFKADNGKLWPFKEAADVPGRAPDSLPRLEPSSRPVWGPLVTHPTGVYANVTVPLLRDGQTVAYLTAATSLASIGEAVRALDEGPDTTTFVLTSGGDVLVHSDQHLLITGTAPATAPPASLEDFGDPVLSGIATGQRYATFQRAADLGIEVIGINAAAQEFILMRVPVSGYSPEPWIIGQYFRATSVSREIQRVSGSALVGVAAIVIGVLIAVWLGRRVARPLRLLAAQSEHVGRLALDEVTPLPRSRVKEVDQVALAFNAMVIGLKAMNTYVPRSLFRKLMRIGLDQAALAREAELSILFTDIMGFTSLSESLTASETAAMLNEHFAILVAAVEEEGGTVDKFIGDGMMAFWGAPDARADHALAAARTAQKIGHAIMVQNRQRREQGLTPVRVRVGLHSGPVVVGNVGALDRWNYTIVGDAVNVCERLQSLGREFAGEEDVIILVSGETVCQLPQDACVQRVGQQQLRGRSGDIEVWRLDVHGKVLSAMPAEDASAAE
ncbi:adenylate/guanylate cyclase domain-containing protein [Pannonibacter phragmitetus]|uniref:adenylate/guanylate cyclase domain-containing protein n=1 Tax=Pannonibacter phragmitetus TaxID=121719 RepID=UPI001AD8DCB5|nr:adenylate/guanylate cyclase domain-containing protein [Pannonibacter phragmitetus]